MVEYYRHEVLHVDMVNILPYTMLTHLKWLCYCTVMVNKVPTF